MRNGTRMTRKKKYLCICTKIFIGVWLSPQWKINFVAYYNMESKKLTSQQTSQQLYYQRNKDKFKKRYTEYYKKNKQKINEYNRIYWKSYYTSRDPLLNELIRNPCDVIGAQIKRNVRVTF